MGTEVDIMDMTNMQALAEQVLSMSDYRSQLWEYLKNRMNAIAPNLTIMVGELVGARLISHAGSLMNLAKQPASTLQILGAEKALFRALKTKHDTPKCVASERASEASAESEASARRAAPPTNNLLLLCCFARSRQHPLLLRSHELLLTPPHPPCRYGLIYHASLVGRCIPKNSKRHP